jgi:hypothetical protein
MMPFRPIVAALMDRAVDDAALSAMRQELGFLP